MFLYDFNHVPLIHFRSKHNQIGWESMDTTFLNIHAIVLIAHKIICNIQWYFTHPIENPLQLFSPLAIAAFMAKHKSINYQCVTQIHRFIHSQIIDDEIITINKQILAVLQRKFEYSFKFSFEQIPTLSIFDLNHIRESTKLCHHSRMCRRSIRLIWIIDSNFQTWQTQQPAGQKYD